MEDDAGAAWGDGYADGAGFFAPDPVAEVTRASDFFAAHLPTKSKTRILPVRCFGCNRVLGNLSAAYDAGVLRRLAQFRAAGEDDADGLAVVATFRDMGIRRLCCKTILLTWVDHTEMALHTQPALRNTTIKARGRNAPRVICVSAITRKKWLPEGDAQNQDALAAIQARVVGGGGL